MTERWQLRAVYFFSHDGRRRDVAFKLGEVNVVTGGSNTGKSALIATIDYCLGARRCEIADFIRARCCWVASLWERRAEQFLLARRVPGPRNFSSDEYLVDRGASVDVPTDGREIMSNAGAGALRLFEEALGMGDAQTETFGARPKKHLSLRSAMGYLFQSAEVITNPRTLVRGTDGEKRQSILDAAPYFYGVVDEGEALLEQELSTLRRRRERIARELQVTRAQQEQRMTRASALLAEATELGMAAPSAQPTDLTSQLALLEAVRDWTPDTADRGESPLLDQLYREADVLRAEISALSRRRVAAEELLGESSNYTTTVRSHVRRLESVELLPRHGGRVDECPLCRNPLAQQVEPLTKLVHALEALREEVSGVERTRPQLEEELSVVTDQIEARRSALSEVQAQVRAIVSASRAKDAALRLDDRRHRLAGRVSYFLEALGTMEAEDASVLFELDARIADLESRLEQEGKLERLSSTEQRLSRTASDILGTLPFGAEFQDMPMTINLRALRAGIDHPQRHLSMIDVGSDENWLSMHVSFALATQALFGDRRRPVPALLIFDQLTRPYFPADEYPEGVELSAADGDERNKVLTYFRCLLQAAQRHAFQIIVLEHAYFADDQDFISSVRETWFGSRKLIPADWPSAS